jgi:hypothetical protein
MDLLPRGFHVDAPTWFYLSFLLIVAVFFRFHRWWSIRNGDLLLLLAASPGLLLVDTEEKRTLGFVWLFVVTGLFLGRVLLDSLFQRRPHTTQNLNAPGMIVLCVSAFVLLTLQAISVPLPESTQQTLQRADDLLSRTDRTSELSEPPRELELETGPTLPLIAAPTLLLFQHLAPRVMAMMAHLAVIVGLVIAGRRLFGDTQLGIAMATLYLLLPCTAHDVGEFNHVLPAALIVWAVLAYRMPTVSGSLFGLACGTLLFPLFLVPLWTAFYGRKQGLRFLGALTIVFAALLGSAALTSSDPDSFWRQSIGTIRLTVLAFEVDQPIAGFWSEGEYGSPYRIPVIVAYFVMLAAITLVPRAKTLEHLLAQTAALIIGTQFWYPQQGGVYLLWYLPILLMVVFRPRLQNLERASESEVTMDIRTDRGERSRPLSRSAGRSSLQRMQLYR